MCIQDYNQKVLVVDSSKRNSTQSSATNFKINLAQPMNVKGLKLQNFQIPLTWYNITSSNGSFSVNYSSTQYDMSLSGRYTSMLSLLIEIKTNLDAQTGLTFTVSQSNTGKITVSAGSSFDLIFSSGNLWDILGLNSGQTLTGKSSYVFDYVPKLYSLDKYLMLKMDYLEGNVEHINNLQDATTFIIDLPNCFELTFGETVKMNSEADQKIIYFKNPVNIQSFNVSLHNQDNEVIDLNNNDWFMTLLILE